MKIKNQTNTRKWRDRAVWMLSLAGLVQISTGQLVRAVLLASVDWHGLKSLPRHVALRPMAIWLGSRLTLPFRRVVDSDLWEFAVTLSDGPE